MFPGELLHRARGYRADTRNGRGPARRADTLVSLRGRSGCRHSGARPDAVSKGPRGRGRSLHHQYDARVESRHADRRPRDRQWEARAADVEAAGGLSKARAIVDPRACGTAAVMPGSEDAGPMTLSR